MSEFKRAENWDLRMSSRQKTAAKNQFLLIRNDMTLVLDIPLLNATSRHFVW